MEPIDSKFLIVKVDEQTFDVVIFAEKAVLKAFEKIYKAFYIEKSVFSENPVSIVSDFPNQDHAELWKQYWIEAFAEPEKACKTCTTVNDLFSLIEQGRQVQE